MFVMFKILLIILFSLNKKIYSKLALDSFFIYELTSIIIFFFTFSSANLIMPFFRHFLVGPDMGEEFEVTIEKGKTLTIKTLTPGIGVSRYSIILTKLSDLLSHFLSHLWISKDIKKNKIRKRVVLADILEWQHRNPSASPHAILS